MQTHLDKIACADCFDYLATLPAASVDMVLTDPPYGTTKAPWDKRVDEARLFAELWRVAKPSAPVIMFAQNPLAAELIVQQQKNFRYEWIWEKAAARGFLNAGKMPLRAHELILVFYRKLPTYNAIPLKNQCGSPYECTRHGSGGMVCQKTEGETRSVSEDGRRHPRSVVKYSADVLPVHHGTPKPMAIVSMLIQQYTHYGDTVLDPFIGTGTTAAAAKSCGRHFAGCEKCAQYAAFARRRADDTPPPLADFGTAGLML